MFGLDRDSLGDHKNYSTSNKLSFNFYSIALINITLKSHYIIDIDKLWKIFYIDMFKEMRLPRSGGRSAALTLPLCLPFFEENNDSITFFFWLKESEEAELEVT